MVTINLIRAMININNVYGKWYSQNSEFWDVVQSKDLGELSNLRGHL